MKALRYLIYVGLAACSVAAIAQPPLTIANVVPNDDSVQITVNPVPGALDYRVFDVHNPCTVKYSGGNTTVEWNGVDPATGADLVVEAVDAAGPYQPANSMNGSAACACCSGAGCASCRSGQPCSCCTGGSCKCGAACTGIMTSINGQGDPASAPHVIARSTVFHVIAAPHTLTGDQAFFENWRDYQPFQSIPVDPIIAGPSEPFSQYQNPRWQLSFYKVDPTNTSFFVDHDHFMDIVADWDRVAYATSTLKPNASFNFSNGRVLHVTFEVDGHFGGRRWVDTWIIPAGDKMLRPDMFHTPPPTASGSALLVSWQMAQAVVVLYQNGHGIWQFPVWNDWADYTKSIRGSWVAPYAAVKPALNGTEQDLDLRHRFDIYLSDTHITAIEEGHTLIDQDLPQSVGFSSADIYFAHQMYHSALDHQELMHYYPTETDWINNTPAFDLRHWDNMGAEVLPGSTNGTPPAPPTGLVASPGNGSVQLAWSAGNGASGYNILRAAASTGPFSTIASKVASTSYSDTGITNGQEYYYQVEATSSSGVSGPSNTASATPAAGQTATAAAAFAGTDTSTAGNWIGKYGSKGYSIAQCATQLPSYVNLSVSGERNYLWAPSTIDSRCIRKPSGSDRIGSAWDSGTSFTFDLNMTDGATHQVSLYALDWDMTTRAERIDILDAATGALLSSQNLSNFHCGEYARWNIKGHVTIRVTRTGRYTGPVSGIFFD
ncbi:MAG TPA: fibronectin type III domain-containing protein [Chthonomonadales bacterium]|nr:fibronectin type III domain-containing protein [Chthonomonadales bacterium]